MITMASDILQKSTIGIFRENPIGVSFNDESGKWVAIDNNGDDIGEFASREGALIARDLEIIRKVCDIELLNQELNRPYTIFYDSELPLQNIQLRESLQYLKDSQGRRISLSNLPEIPISENRSEILDFSASEFVASINSSGNQMIAQYQNVHRLKRWSDRITSSYLPPAIFTYDITFYGTGAIGLNLKSSTVGADKINPTVDCCIVLDCVHTLSHVVSPNDILLSLNNVSLVQPSNLFDFDKITQLITTIPAPRVLRFIRSGYGMQLSPLHLHLYCSSDSPVMAKFKASTAMGNIPPSINLTFIDSNAPSFIKKFMNGNQKFDWEIPNPQSQIIQPTIPIVNPVAIPGKEGEDSKEISPLSEIQMNPSNNGTNSFIASTCDNIEGVFRERNGKWVSVISLNESELPSIGKRLRGIDNSLMQGQKRCFQFFLGRFDSEMQANTSLIQSKLELQTTGLLAVRNVK